ncbi:MAG TPA: glutathione S-transferase family protein [Polyangiaceae bacterium]
MKRATLLVESTPACGQTPHLLVLLEELSVPYELVVRPEGYFLATYARPGPRFVDGDLTLFELTAMLRHCARTQAGGRLLPRSPYDLARVDAWLELACLLGLAMHSLRREEREQGEERRPARIEEERARIAAIIQILERALDDSDGDWVLGDFGLVDCALVGLPRLTKILDLAAFPRVRAYCARLLLRPAIDRAQAVTRSSPVASGEFSSCSMS